MSRRSSTKKNKAPEFPRVFEMFADPTYEISRGAVTFDAPGNWNGVVRLKRYRVTIEAIEEPIDVYHERLRQLWRGSKNYHDRTTLEHEAKALGIVLNPEERGVNVKEQ